MYTGIAVGVVILGGILIIVAVIVMVAVYRRKCHNSGYQRVMSEENHSINHYGAIPKATPAQRLRNPLGDSMPSSREEIVREVGESKDCRGRRGLGCTCGLTCGSS